MATFFKQYGAHRTGTNVVRTLLTDNFRDVVVLMHVLGDKHSRPVDLAEVLRASEAAADPAWDFVTRATWSMPAASTNPQAERQLAYLRSVAAPVLEAARARRIAFVISARDPYSWAYGIVAYRGWYRRRYRTVLPSLFSAWLRPRIEHKLRHACRELNRTTAAWLDLLDRHPDRTSVVRLEDLWKDQRAMLDALARKHGLEPRSGEPKLLAGSTVPAHWDHEQAGASALAAVERRDQLRRDFAPMAAMFERVVGEEISWPLLGRLGYARRG